MQKLPQEGLEKRTSADLFLEQKHKSARRKLFPFEFENSETGFGRMIVSGAQIRSQNRRTRTGTIFAGHFSVLEISTNPRLSGIPSKCVLLCNNSNTGASLRSLCSVVGVISLCRPTPSRDPNEKVNLRVACRPRV